MKKILALLLAVVMVLGMVACASKTEAPAETTTTEPAAETTTEETKTEEPAKEEETATEEQPAEEGVIKKVALVTDVGTIDDESFNQATWQGVKAYCEANGIEYTYYQPTEDSTDARCISIDQAIKEGANVVVMPGYLFGGSIVREQEKYPEVYFIAVDVGAGDLTEDYATYYDPAKNVVCATFAEEQAGYLAGYAAVQEGYKELGFLGGIDVPAVIRYGYGFIMGADKAAQELNLTDVNIKYWYSGSFQPNDDIATKMDNWYVGGTEVVFACGGGIYLSCLSAAESNDGKMIGVDVDQSNVSDRIITSAMKALSNSVVKALTDASANDWIWPESYAGVCQYLGAADDCVGLPMETSQFTKFTQEQYDTLFQAMADGSLVVDNNSSADVKPVTTNVTVDYQ